MDTQILDQIKSRFTYPPENWERLVRLWENDSPISFYSWECPPRQIQEDPELGRWVNFDVNIALVVKGKKLDEYTELPRLTTQPAKEKWFIDKIVKKNPQASYTKIVADTNAIYLFTKSRRILGDKKIAELSKKFQKLLEEKANSLFGYETPPFVLYTDLMNKFKLEYEMFFKLVYRSFKNKSSQFIPKEIVDAWMDCLIDHVGLTEKDKIERLDILKRVIASYATEGMVFELLNQNSIFSNPAWVNWEEKPKLATTTQILRERYGLKPLPIIYFVEK